MQLPNDFDPLDPRPVLIAGPTASGKSSLALRLAADCPSAIINADALQVYSGWHTLTARPSEADLAAAQHHLYGHIDMSETYSVGHWMRECARTLDMIAADGLRPVIVGGTGLYFRALTEGLADIPVISEDVREAADEVERREGLEGFAKRLLEEDVKTAGRLDLNNPARTRRAWEVLHSTGRPLADWQDDTPPPLIPLRNSQPLLVSGPPDTLRARIDRRLDQMIESGALAEVDRARRTFWDPNAPSCQAIGAAELISYLDGDLALDEAVSRAKIATHQYAKRQRTWFRTRMRDWSVIEMQ
ncbi:MAG: tRNA (adenosine(37)-N6)-dimethylallyltransferase MiaA [Pseudomonadota bacterium]